MALIGTGSPQLYVEISGSQLSGSGTSRTVRVSFGAKVNGGSASYFGYPANYRTYVQNKDGGYNYGAWATLKGSESWNGSNSLRYYSQDISVDVGTSSSKAVTIGVQVSSSTSSWNGSANSTMTVGATNERPVISGSVTVSPSGTIPENTAEITITAPKATDANGNLSGYRAQVQVNGGDWVDIYSGASQTYKHNVSKYAQGTTLRYRFDAYDSAGSYSVDWVYSTVVTKNTLTADTITTTTSTMDYDSTKLVFANSGAKNTNGNTEFTKVLTCNLVTVYNGTNANYSDVVVYKTGTVPTKPYIKFSDLTSKLSGTSYKGTLTFTLKTTNKYGSSKSTSVNVTADLRTAPNPATGQVISTVVAESTIYKKPAFTTAYYYIPDGTGRIRVKWTPGSGKLGETITQELYVAYGTGSWQKLADLARTTTYYDHVIAKQYSKVAIKYMIRTKNSFGYNSDAATAGEFLHYYNPPTISEGNHVRGGTTCEVRLTVKVNSSILNVGVTGTWNRFASGTTTPSQQNGNLTNTTNEQMFTLTGLLDSGQYDVSVSFNDNTGFSTAQKYTIKIGANTPVFVINKYGIGVGGAKATERNALVVAGSTNLDSIGKTGTGVTGNVAGTFIPYPQGGTYRTTISSVTGALKITLPQGYTSTMLNFEVDIYNYGNNDAAWLYRIGGYPYEVTPTWNCCSASCFGPRLGGKRHLQVRFGYDGTKCCIYIGELDTVWAYPQVTVRNIQTGYKNYAKELWDKDWRIDFVTSFDTVNVTVNTMIGETEDSTNTLVARNSNGDISSRLFKSTYQNQTSISGAIAYRVNNSTDNYIRFCSDMNAIRKGIKANPLITNNLMIAGDGDKGWREGIIDLGNGFGVWYDWVTMTTTGDAGGTVYRSADVNTTITSKIKSVLTQQATIMVDSTWGYVTGGYNHASKKIELSGSDFANVSGKTAKCLCTVFIEMTPVTTYSLGGYKYLELTNFYPGHYIVSDEPTNIVIYDVVIDELARLGRETNVYFQPNPEVIDNLDGDIEITMLNYENYFTTDKPPMALIDTEFDALIADRPMTKLIQDNETLKAENAILRNEVAAIKMQLGL